MARKRSGPEARGSAQAGPAKLSAVDGASITLSNTDRQRRAAGRHACGANLVLIVTPDPKRSGYFTARLAGVDRVLAHSRTPFFDAARALIAAGFDPTARLIMVHAGSATESLSAIIGDAALATVEESTHGPVVRTFRTASPSAVEAPRMRSREWAGPRGADP